MYWLLFINIYNIFRSHPSFWMQERQQNLQENMSVLVVRTIPADADYVNEIGTVVIETRWYNIKLSWVFGDIMSFLLNVCRFECHPHHIDGLVQERHNSIANAMDFRLKLVHWSDLLNSQSSSRESCIHTPEFFRSCLSNYHPEQTGSYKEEPLG